MKIFPRDLLIRVAQEHKLTITIRPDGSVFGDPVDVQRLWELLHELGEPKHADRQ